MSATPTYPGDRSNEPESNSQVARDLVLLNQPAGGLEFRNTKDDEAVTLYHKNGSVIRFNKLSNDYLHTKDKREHVMGDLHVEVNGNVVQIFDKDVETIHLGDKINKTGDIDKWQKYTDEYKKVISDLHNVKRLFEIKRVKVHNFIDQAPEQTKSGSLAPCPTEATTSRTLYTVKPTVYVKAEKSLCSRTTMGLIAPEVEFIDVIGGGGKMFADGWECLTCWGTGNSPSSQDGVWDEETLKQQITQNRVDLQKQLFDIEKELGQNKHRNGGTQIDQVAKDLTQVIGLTFNDFESFRRDPKGKLVPYGVKIDPFGSGLYVQYRESTLVERVHADKILGGAYTLVANDSYKIIAGANGVSIKTVGPMEVSAPIYNASFEDVSINSRGGFVIGGERVDISGEIITIRPKRVQRTIEDAAGNVIPILPANLSGETEPEQQLLVDGNLNVSMNLITKGGAHIEGELTVQHITAPLEYQITESDFEWGSQSNCLLDGTVDEDCTEPVQSATRGDIVPNCLIGECVVGSGSSAGVWPVYSVCAPNSVLIHPHHHYFKNIPLKLIRDNTEVEVTVGNKLAAKTLDPNSVVRAIGARNNFAMPVIPKPVHNSTTNNTVHEKFGGSLCAPLVIDNGNWEESNRNDTLPKGEGVRTSNYPDSDLFERVKELEKKLEEKYKELQDKLDALTTK